MLLRLLKRCVFAFILPDSATIGRIKESPLIKQVYWIELGYSKKLAAWYVDAFDDRYVSAFPLYVFCVWNFFLKPVTTRSAIGLRSSIKFKINVIGRSET
jgi:hypothetical protein